MQWEILSGKWRIFILFKNWLNKIEKKVTDISDRNYSAGLFSFEWFLVVISHAYGLGSRLRILLYKTGVLRQRKLDCFVISIGNIVVGGAGKTPTAIYLAGLLKKMGKRPVVISRGYGGKYKQDSVVVTDGKKTFLDADVCGDEPYMMAKRKVFPVGVGRDRFKAGIKAVNEFNADVIILDDGFQHLKLKRDFDLLLLDCSNSLGNKRFLPAGRLRETFQTSSKRADALIFTRCPRIDNAGIDKAKTDKIEKICDNNIENVLPYYPDCPWFKTFHSPFILNYISADQSQIKNKGDISSLKGKKAVLFSGIAKNESFCQLMKELGINVLDHLEFKDHYKYKKSDIFQINNKAVKLCADVILTTEKDWAKLDKNFYQTTKIDLIVIGIKIEFEHPEKFESLLSSKLKINEE